MSATHRLLRFGLFELNLDTEELRKDGIPLKLGPQPFKVLSILASRSGQIVTRDEIRQEVWGEETYVDFEHGLNQCIKQIRTALNDNSSKPLYIETLPRKGYRFLAPVTSKTIAVLSKVTASSSGVQPRVHLPGATAAASAPPAAPIADREAQAVAAAPSRPSSDVDSALEASLGGEAATAEKIAPATVRQGKPGRMLRWLAVPVLAAIAIAFYWHSQNANALTEKDTVLLADFENSTQEPLFDDALKQGLRIQLEQSPYLALADETKVIATLKLMGRSPADRLTPALSREVCQRIGTKAFVAGSIAPLGNQYVVSVKVLNCSSGDLLAEAQEQARSTEDVLKALDRAATKVRRNVGESLRSVEAHATPIEEATTPSLEALKAYSLGRKMSALKGDTASLAFYKRAVELDPNFAMAYRYMSSAYTNLNEIGVAAEMERKAYDLRQKVTERERLLIEGHYYIDITGELDKAAQAYEVGKQAFPRDAAFSRNLIFVYSRLGDYEKAAAEASENLLRDAGNGMNYSNLGGDYLDLNRFQDAEAVYKDAESRHLDGEWLLGNRYNLAFVQGDTAQMEKLVAAAQGKPGYEDLLLATHSDTLAWYGKLHGAREMTHRAIESAVRNDASETAALYQSAAALRDVESGDRERAHDQVQAAMKLASNRDVQAVSALVLARVGGSGAQLEALTAGLEKQFPVDTMVQKYWLPSIRAAAAMQRGQANQAVEELRVSIPYDLASPSNATAVLVPVYLRGQAYLMLRQGAAARAEFQKLVDHRGLAGNFQWAVLARLGVARAYALDAQSDSAAREKARAAYQEFLTLWKDADPDIPIYQEAKAEYARLMAVGP